MSRHSLSTRSFATRVTSRAFTWLAAILPHFMQHSRVTKIINEIGVEKIREKSMRQTSYLIQLAEEAGFKVTSPKEVRDSVEARSRSATNMQEP